MIFFKICFIISYRIYKFNTLFKTLLNSNYQLRYKQTVLLNLYYLLEFSRLSG